MFKKSANLKCFKYCRQEYCPQEYCPHFGTGMKILSIQKKPKCRTLEEWLRTLSPRVENSSVETFVILFFMKISNYLIYFPKIQLLSGN